MRAERTRSLSPEKRSSIAPSQTISIGVTGPSTPYLSSKPNLTSKEEEIKRTIAAIAGPTGTLPLFPQTKLPNSNLITASPPPARNTSESTRIDFDTGSSSKQSIKVPFKSPEETPSFSLAQKKSGDDEKPAYILPNKAPAIISDTRSSYTRLAKSMPTPKSKPDEDSSPVYALPMKKAPLPGLKQVEADRPIYALPKRNHSFPAKEEENSILIGISKKTSPPAVAPKPKQLSSQLSDKDELQIEKTEIISIEEEAPFFSAEGSESSSLLNDKGSHKIISGKTSSAGLRKFLNTIDHNNHNQVSTSINGLVPLPGMAKSSSNSAVSFNSSPNTSTSPHASYLSTRATPNFSPRPSPDLNSKPSISPAGSFLASRSMSPVSRPKSPVRGGFVQSAMLKREGTITKAQAGSPDISSPSLADSLVFSLVNPVARTSSRTPSPTRGHSLSQSTTSFNSVTGFSSKNATSAPALRPKPAPSESSSKLEGMQRFEKPKAESSDFHNLKEEEKTVIENTPTRTSRESMSPQNAASRRWSPTRSTWLESALKKSPSPGVEQLTRSNTLAKSDSLVTSGFASHSNGTKAVPPKPPAKWSKTHSAIPREPPLHGDTEVAAATQNKKDPVIELKPVVSPSDPRPQPALNRSNTVKPVPPKKLDMSQVPSDALEKLRQLRAGTLNAGNNAQDIATLARLKETVRGFKSNEEKKQAKEEKEEKEERPLFPKPPALSSTPPLVTPKPLPPKPQVSRTAQATKIRVPLPSTLIPHKYSLEPGIPDEPIVMKYQPAPDTDSTLDNAAIPSVISKRTAKSFASNLSEVLQRGKPLTSLEDTTTNFSPRFERMTEFAGPKKARTFDDDLLLPTGSNKEPQKKELVHMTKSRAKGPKRRLPKAATAPTPASATRSMDTPNSTIRPRTHMRQRSRSLSPGLKQPSQFGSIDQSFHSASTTPNRHRSPSPPPFPTRPNQQVESAAKIFAPSNSFKPKPVIRGGLNVPKVRSSAATDPADSPGSIRPKPVIKTSSRVVSEKMLNDGDIPSSLAKPAQKPLPVPPKPRKLSVNVADQ